MDNLGASFKNNNFKMFNFWKKKCEVLISILFQLTKFTFDAYDCYLTPLRTLGNFFKKICGQIFCYTNVSGTSEIIYIGMVIFERKCNGRACQKNNISFKLYKHRIKQIIQNLLNRSNVRKKQKITKLQNPKFFPYK